MTYFKMAVCAVAAGLLIAWYLYGLLAPPLTWMGLM